MPVKNADAQAGPRRRAPERNALPLLFVRLRPGARAGRCVLLLTSVLAVPSVPAFAQSVPAQSLPGAPPESALGATVLPNVDVVGSTPLQGSGVERDKVPANTNVLTSGQISNDGTANLLRTIDEQIAGATLSDATGNPFQPNLVYRGFAASPLDGNAQGLAVYVNGARFNSAFADTVNFDLIPSNAIASADLVGSNPAFGLNALGGSLSIQMKNGFTYHGAEMELSGGSFGTIEGSGQFGIQTGNVAAYAALTAINTEGWRQDSPSQLRQFYGDVGWRSERAEGHINLTLADNSLVGPGTTPVQLLDVNRAATFTSPNLVTNQSIRVVATNSYDVTDTTSLQAVAYYSYLYQQNLNGNAGNVSACTDGSNLVCETGVGPLTTTSGATIPNFVVNSPYNSLPGFAGQFAAGGPYSVLNTETTNTNSFGASGQVTNTDPIFGHNNQFVAGLSYDGGRTMFAAQTLLGGLTLDRDWFAPPFGQVFSLDLADGSVTPVRVGVANNYYGAFAVDTFDITPRLTATLSGRFNMAQIDLSDELGTALNGNHTYSHLNPGAGLTYKITQGVSVYGGYAVSNRAPTPSELSCADPSAPCSLANFFVGDPNLKQVVAHTWEAGFNGRGRLWDGGFIWHAGYFHTTNDDDILFVSSPTIGRDYFENVGQTLRQGLELSASYKTERLSLHLGYAYTSATFGNSLILNSPDNPYADANGNIYVQPGDRLPGIPANTLKFGADYAATQQWSVGFNGIFSSGTYLFGDESNQNPTTGAYTVIGVHTSYKVSPNLEFFGRVENAFNAKYATYGTFSPTSDVPIVQVPGAANPRSLSPGAPIGGFGGVRVTF